MGQIRRHFLTILLGVLTILLGAAALPAWGQKFYPDDPLWKEPPPLAVAKASPIDINLDYDFFRESFFEPDKEEIKHHNPCPSQAINTLGEVPDSSWFTNRLGTREMTLEELVRGPGISNAPATDKPWTVTSGKNQGISPGLVFLDSRGHKYFLKFDPKTNPEMASAADVIGAKFLYDLGYFTPENYIVRFDRSQLVLNEKSHYKDAAGREHPMTDWDVDNILKKVPRDKDGRYRGMASLNVAGGLLGPHRYYGTRTDDPNDIVPHENRRDQRGLYVFFAWLNHTDAKALNSMDSLVEENGVRYVKHFLLDFGDIMGSDSDTPKDPRRGHVYAFDFTPALEQFASVGLYIPSWMRAHYPDIPEIGNFDSKSFDPEDWHSNFPNPAFGLRTPGDTYWAAKKLMAMGDEAIRAIVETGQYSDPHAVDWATRCLIERRDKIGRAFFADVLPLDNFQVRNGELVFENLAVKYHFENPRSYTVQWFTFDNRSGGKAPIAGASSFAVPQGDAAILAANIHGADSTKTVTVYLRGGKVIGVDRTLGRPAGSTGY
jgi:hypothetical protein